MNNNDFSAVVEVGEEYLEHHGVEGMKWGVWNEETRLKYLGSPPEYGTDSNFDLLDELSQGDIEDFYQSGKISGFGSKSGMRYYNDIPTERLTLPTDTVFTSYGSSEKSLDGPLWTTWKEDASSTYRNFGDTKYELSPKRDFSVASMKDSYDTFTDLFSEDGESGQAFRSSVYETRLGPLGKERASVYASAASNYPEAAASDCYKSFVHNQYKQTDATNTFFHSMESKGFDGILDQNDIDDYTRQSPVIVLNPSESLELKSSVKHSDTTENSFSAIEFDDYLEHYGVKGMKWGVWNEETKAKYNGGLGRASNAMKAKLSQAGSAVGGGAKAIKRFTGKSVASAKAQVATMAGNSKAKREAKKEEKKEIAAQRKELGMTRVEYGKLRDQTLKSHDPNVIARGMHTLTDEELASKINRLNEENKVTRMASERTAQMYDAKKRRNEALNANPLVQVGKVVLSDAGKNYANGLVNKMLGRGAAERIENAVNETSKKEEKKPNNNSQTTQGSVSNPSTPFSQYSNAATYGAPREQARSEQVRTNYTRPLLTGTVSTSAAQSAASKGKSYVDSDVIDAKVSDFSSARSGGSEKQSKYSSTVSSGKKWWDLEGKSVIDNDNIPKPKNK